MVQEFLSPERRRRDSRSPKVTKQKLRVVDPPFSTEHRDAKTPESVKMGSSLPHSQRLHHGGEGPLGFRARIPGLEIRLCHRRDFLLSPPLLREDFVRLQGFKTSNHIILHHTLLPLLVHSILILCPNLRASI